MSERQFVIAIDGPAGSGKSTTARIVAQRLGFAYLDSGAMYRAAMLKVLRNHIPIGAEKAIVELLKKSVIEFSFSNGEQKVLLDGEDVTEEIRSAEVTANVSAVAKIPQVRNILVEQQQRIAEKQNIVAEGRDMTSVVFPSADLKIYLQASLEERAKRRKQELLSKGFRFTEEQIREDIKRRDLIDSSRSHSPLKRTKDSIVLDTTFLTINEQVDVVIKEAKRLLSEKSAQV